MDRQFAQEVALITGGGSGIGRATALLFADEGAKVVIADLNVDGSHETIQQIQARGGDAIFIRTDVSRPAEVKEMVEKTVEAYGRLDYAFNNAGITGPLGVAPVDYPEEAWDAVIRVNLTGVWLCMKYEIQQMLKQSRGAIVNMASGAGLVAISNQAYTASKHGVVGLTKSAALTFSQAGIRVNAVCPGYIVTPMTDPIISDPMVEATLKSRHPIGRLGVPEEVAEAVIWLCSDSASFVTGHAMAVDGGYTAQ
jgi:NAD(P)-dependent dehydrogenase (short-subunit alcohol dehydrogenase family)